MAQSNLLPLVAFLPLFAVACGDTVTPADDGAAGGPADDQLGDDVCFCHADSGEELTGYADDAGTCVCEDGDAATLEAVSACGIGAGCGEVMIQLIEGTDYNLQGDATCLIEALRDKTPGTYELRSTDSFSNGEVDTLHTLVVDADGAVFRTSTQHSYAVYDDLDENITIYGDAEVCEVTTSEALDACLAKIDESPDAAAECLYGDSVEDLFASCEAMSEDACTL